MSLSIFACLSYNCELVQCSRSMVGYFKRLKTSGSVSLEAFKMYYVMRVPIHRDSLREYNTLFF